MPRPIFKIAATFFLLALGVSGCRGVQPGDFVGTWVLSDESRKLLPADFRQASGRVVVSADGTFVAEDLPEQLPPVFPDVNSQVRLDSGGGKWKLAAWEGAEHLQLEFRNGTFSKGESHETYGFPLTVSRGWSSITLSYALGDPDQGVLELEKK